MSRIPKVKRWLCTHTWTGRQVHVEAPTRLLAKLNAAREIGIPALWCGEFTARLKRKGEA